MKNSILLLICIIPVIVNSQSLSPERVAKLKSSTVRITVEDGLSEGTGFFINSEGHLLTCWHVIKPAIQSTNNKINFKKIFIELNTGEKIEVRISNLCLVSKGNISAVSNDYCILSPLTPIKIKHSFLKIGNFDNIQEGEEIYTCGYPLGLYHPFISKGILSTKFIDTVSITDNKGSQFLTNRYAALMDLTLNSGNSGGAILKLGATINDDEVIGIADFKVNPLSNTAEKMLKQVSEKHHILDGIEIGGVSQGESLKLFSNGILLSSNGISGCISINHVLPYIQNSSR